MFCVLCLPLWQACDNTHKVVRRSSVAKAWQSHSHRHKIVDRYAERSGGRAVMEIEAKCAIYNLSGIKVSYNGKLAA